jgi:hypothetical protein
MDRRVRERQIIGPAGTVFTVSGGVETVQSTKSPTLEEWYCEDYIHKVPRLHSSGGVIYASKPPSPCVISKHHRAPYALSRESSGTFRFRNYPVDNQGTTGISGFDSVRPALGSTSRINENNNLALSVLAETNPFRPEYSVPISIKELIDLGTLFKISTSSFASYAGSAYLTYKFGWQQFVNDIKTLHGITSTLEKRIREFNSLTKKGGIRRSVYLKTVRSNYLNASSTIHSTWGVNVDAKVTGKYTCKTHGTVRWTIREGYDTSLTKLQAFNTAVTAVFDLGIPDKQTVWGLIPFSWLVDYFIDVDAWYTASINTKFIEFYDLCIVRHCESSFKQQVISKPASITITGDGVYGRSHIERDVVTSVAFPTSSIQFLNKNQMLTVAALLANFKR